MEQNKATVRAYADAFSRGDFDAVMTLCTPDVTIQGVLGQGSWDVILPIWRDLHDAYGITLQIEELVCEGDQVATRYIERGVFRRAFRGVEPTNKSYELVAMEWFLMRDGKIARRWGARDYASMRAQLGIG